MQHVLQYPITLTKAEEGGFIVTSPVISIFTQGDTEEEAIENAQEAIQCHIEGSKKEERSGPSIQLKVIQVTIDAPDTSLAA